MKWKTTATISTSGDRDRPRINIQSCYITSNVQFKKKITGYSKKQKSVTYTTLEKSDTSKYFERTRYWI